MDESRRRLDAEDGGRLNQSQPVGDRLAEGETTTATTIFAREDNGRPAG